MIVTEATMDNIKYIIEIKLPCFSSDMVRMLLRKFQINAFSEFFFYVLLLSSSYQQQRKKIIRKY